MNPLARLRRLARAAGLPVVLRDPAIIAEALRHPDLRDRAELERALSSFFFQPFVHQEVVEGDRFARRAAFSRAALALDPDLVRQTARLEVPPGGRPTLGPTASLLDELRRHVTAVTVRLTFGDDAPFAVVHAAALDLDRGIKLSALPRRGPRLALWRLLAERLADPERWPEGTTLAAGRDEAAGLDLDERIHHVGAVLLGTGIIQITDSLTHALVALSQQPEARVHDDEAVLRETLRRYPVNSSITRRARAPVALGDQALAAGDSLAVVPEEVNRHGWPEPDRFDPGRFSAKSPAGYSFAFGAGPRACPAQRFSLTLLGELLATYRRLGVEVPRRHPHHRSLAVPIPAMIGGGACAAQPLHERLQHRARYLACAAATYPLAALHRHP
ncbi:MAG: cytochrome P450 [Polyangiaceae bacterium]